MGRQRLLRRISFVLLGLLCATRAIADKYGIDEAVRESSERSGSDPGFGWLSLPLLGALVGGAAAMVSSRPWACIWIGAGIGLAVEVAHQLHWI